MKGWVIPYLSNIGDVTELSGRREFHPGPEGMTLTFPSGMANFEQMFLLENSETATTISDVRADSVENDRSPTRRLVDIFTTDSM